MKKSFAFALVVLASLIARHTQAQSIASRVASVHAGKVRFTFAARPDVCGYGNSINRGHNSGMGYSGETADVSYDDECSHSPVRVVLYMNAGRIEKLRTYVGGRWRPATSETVDLGAVSVRDATTYLLSLAANETGKVGQEAILPATLADSVVIWPQLIKIARDPKTPRSTERQAMFWLAEGAADVVSPDRDGKARESDDTELRKQAVFALTQRRNGEAVPALIDVARNNRDPEVRRSALFWLGQTNDPRALSLFEEILSR